MDLWLAIVLIIVFAVIAGIVAFYAGINYRKRLQKAKSVLLKRKLSV